MQEVILSDTTGITTKEAKAFYLKQPGIIVNFDENGYLGTPDWNRTLSVKVSDNESAMKVALDNPKLDHTIYRDLIFTRDKSGITRCRVFEVQVHPGYLLQKQHQKGLGFNTRNYIGDADFTGLLILYELNGSIVKGRKYEDGILKSELTFEPSEPEPGIITGDHGKSLNNRKKTPSDFYALDTSTGFKVGNPVGAACKTDKDCGGSGVCVLGVCQWIINIPGVTIKSDAPPKVPLSLYDWQQPITSIQGYTVGWGNPSSSGSGGSQSSSSPLPIGWEPDLNVVYLYSQKNLLKNPCISAVVNSIIKNHISNEIITKMNAIFNFSDKVNLIFKDMDQFLIDGPTRTPLGPKVMGATIVKPTSSGVIDVVVYLNSIQSSAATEFIAQTVIHEIEHGILTWNNFMPESVQHNEMLQSYYKQDAALLQGLYPNLSDFDAKSLIWSGLWDTVWGQSLYDVFPGQANGLIDRAMEYFDATKGTKCIDK